MTRVKRGGRELVVDESMLTEYLKDGYSVIDDSGNEITPGRAMNYPSALRRIAELEAHDKAVSASLEEANRQLTKLKAENRKLKATQPT